MCFSQARAKYFLVEDNSEGDVRSVYEVNDERPSSEACCRDKHVLSCRDVNVNPEILETKEDIRFADVVVSFKSTVSPNGYVYENPAGDTAVITFDWRSGNMHGSFQTSDRSFAIEKCSSGHTWKEFDVNSFEDH